MIVGKRRRIKTKITSIELLAGLVFACICWVSFAKAYKAKCSAGVLGFEYF